jgi:uncharacterized membrane protein
MAGKFHLLLLHFPIALLYGAVVADFLWLVARGRLAGLRPMLAGAGFYCLLFGAIMAIPTVVTGDMFLDAQNFVGVAADMAENHEHAGIATLALAIAAAAVRTFRRNALAGWWRAVYGVLIVATFLAVTATGFLGGELAWGSGWMWQP